MRVYFKEGVHLRGLKPEVQTAMLVAYCVCDSFNKPMRITSVGEGAHSFGSLHYQGQAFDFDTGAPGFDGSILTAIGSSLKEELTDEFDIVVEETHIHLEWQPKDH